MAVRLVEAQLKHINNNNLIQFSPFNCTELNGDPIQEEKSDAGSTCEECGRSFPTFSQLYKHKAAACKFEDSELVHPIRISFPLDTLPTVSDFLASKNISVETDAKTATCSIQCDILERKRLFHELYFAQCSRFNLERWYYPLMDHWQNLCQHRPDLQALPLPTSLSVFVSLTDAELQLIQKLGMRSSFGVSELNRAENSQLAALERRITEAMAPNSRYFVRMSARSPKDSTAIPTLDVLRANHHGSSSSESSPATSEAVQDTSVTENKSAEATSTVERVETLEDLQLRHGAMVVAKATDATKLLTTSQRVFQDITNFFKFRQALGEMNIILRSFVDHLPLDHEFRCYVHRKQITAISQYYVYQAFPALQDHDRVTRIRQMIIDFHDLIKDAMPFQSYVIDIVVFVEQGYCQVVEINPFGAHLSSGSGLFNWVTDHDLLYGKEVQSAPEIRVLSRLLED